MDAVVDCDESEYIAVWYGTVTSPRLFANGRRTGTTMIRPRVV